MVYHISYLHFSKHAPLVGAICHLALALLYGSVKKNLFIFTKMSPPLYYQNVQVLYFENFHQKFCTVAMRNLHTRHTLSKNDLHIVTICNDSSKFVNSLRLL